MLAENCVGAPPPLFVTTRSPADEYLPSSIYVTGKVQFCKIS